MRKKTTAELVGERPTLEDLKKLPRAPISIIADNIRSLDNTGLLFRLAEVSRLEKLYLTGYTGYPTFSKRHEHRIAKTAVYALPHQPWEHHPDPVALVKNLKKDNHQIIALEQTNASIPYHKIPAEKFKLPIAIIAGHEREGVRPELLKLADLVVEIPILGLGNSHNVAIATSIILYHLLAKTGQLP